MNAPSAEGGRGRVALVIAHCAGMVDLVALPIWIGALIASYGFDPQKAGGLLTLFLLGVVGSSVVLARRFGKLTPRVVAASGFFVAGLTFLLISQVSAYGVMAGLHAVAGLAVGCGLSATHGSVGASAQPHRLFAIASVGLGVFGVCFMASVPRLIGGLGGPALFVVLGAVMVLAAVMSMAFFPAPTTERMVARNAEGHPGLGQQVWFGIAGICCMTFVQAMTFAFAERAGIHRGFGTAAVTNVLVVMGLIALVPGILSVLLEKRWSTRAVILCAPVVQASLCAMIVLRPEFAAYAVAVVLFPAVIIFTHPFAFGLLARLDPTHRAVAATPAMVMTGAAFGPILGGTLVKLFGYGSLAVVAGMVATAAVICFWRASVDGEVSRSIAAK